MLTMFSCIWCAFSTQNIFSIVALALHRHRNLLLINERNLNAFRNSYWIKCHGCIIEALRILFLYRKRLRGRRIRENTYIATHRFSSYDVEQVLSTFQCSICVNKSLRFNVEFHIFNGEEKQLKTIPFEYEDVKMFSLNKSQFKWFGINVSFSKLNVGDIGVKKRRTNDRDTTHKI